jgi:hypothetical protein
MTTPGFNLTVGTHRIPLTQGTLVTSNVAPALGGGGMAIAQVNVNPKSPDVLGLKNVGKRPWPVRYPDGRSSTIEPESSVRLIEGLQIDFGGATGVIGRAAPTTPREPIDRATVERLARKLFRGAKEGLLDQKAFDELHRKFYVRDKQGYGWTVGLQSRNWLRYDSSGWIAGPPPDSITIDPATLEELKALESRLKT